MTLSIHSTPIYVVGCICRNLRAFWGDQTDPKPACGGPNSIVRTGKSTVTPSLLRASFHVSAWMFLIGQKGSKIMLQLCWKPVPHVPTIFSVRICRIVTGKFLLDDTFIWDTSITALIFIHLCSGQLRMSTFSF